MVEDILYEFASRQEYLAAFMCPQNFGSHCVYTPKNSFPLPLTLEPIFQPEYA